MGGRKEEGRTEREREVRREGGREGGIFECTKMEEI